MYTQKEILRTNYAMDLNGEYILELPKSGILSSLALYLRSTQNGAPFATAVKWRLIDYISKIEVIGDGTEVIKSFDGRQALACAFYDQGVTPPSMWRTYSNTPCRQWVVLNFGRKIGDLLRGLDLSKFTRVELKVTNDATSTQYQTSVQLDVIAYWLRELTTPIKGYYREEAVAAWLPVAAGTEYNSLPTRLGIRRILLRARPGVDTADAKNNSTMHALMNDIDFTMRSGVIRVYKGPLATLGHLSIMEQGFEPITMTNITRTDEYGYEVGIGYVTEGVKSAGTSTTTPVAGAGSKGAANVQDSAQEVQMVVADEPLEGIFRGHGYMHNVPLFNSTDPNDADILDPEKDKTVNVDITPATGTVMTGTSKAAENAIVLSRLVKY